MTRRGAALLAVVAMTAAGTPTGPAAGSAQPERPARILVDGLPAYLSPGQPLQVRAQVVNDGDDPLRQVRVRLRLGRRPVGSRSALAAFDASPGTFGAPFADARLDELPPAAVAPVAIAATPDDLPKLRGSPALYPLRVEVRASRGGTVDTYGVTDTFLPWWPAETQRTPIAWLWPIVERSHRVIGSTFADERLAASVNQGRLDNLLDAALAVAPRVPVTWAIDPETVESVARMADGYRVVRGDNTVPGRGSSRAARQWLTRLRDAVTPATVVALPYGDPDVVALVRASLGGDVDRAATAGRQALAAHLGLTMASNVAWPPGGHADTATLDTLVGPESRGVILSDGSLPTLDDARFTPAAPYRLDLGAAGVMTALVSDGKLAELLQSGAGGGGARLAQQRFLAETAMVALERPSDPRALLAAPPRSWDPGSTYATGLLRLTGEVPWLAPVALPDLLTQEPSDVRRRLVYAGRDDELPVDYLDELARIRRRHLQFVSILLSREGLATDLDESLLRAESAQWRNDLTGGRRLLGAVSGALEREFAKVRVSAGGVKTMTSKTGQIPITVVNELGQPVRVRVVVESNSLVLGRHSSAPQEVTGVTTIPIEARAARAGVFPITVKLLAPDSDDVISSATLQVRSTAYGRVALVITVGAFLVLVGGSVTRLQRRRRRAAGTA